MKNIVTINQLRLEEDLNKVLKQYLLNPEEDNVVRKLILSGDSMNMTLGIEIIHKNYPNISILIIAEWINQGFYVKDPSRYATITYGL